MEQSSLPVPVIDAHHHFWKVAAQEQAWRSAEHDLIARDYEPEDLSRELVGSGVDATVLMQSVDSAEENDRLARYAAISNSVAGVVGWLPLTKPAEARAELERAIIPEWRGVRCLVARSPLDWLAKPNVVSLFRDLADRDLAWDVVPITPDQVSAVGALAKAVPNLRIVVDHLARPPVETDGWEPWAEQVSRLAALPTVTMKVSVGIDVLTAWDEWRPADLARYVQHVVASFGPDRIMLASNWPVILLRASYASAWQNLTELVRSTGLTQDEMSQVQGGTAIRAYRLPVAARLAS